MKSGDTLSKIAKEDHGDANARVKIFEANKQMLPNPDKICPGQKLRIPPEQGREEPMSAKAVAEMRSLNTWWTLVKSSLASWMEDYAPSMGAALSYYSVFSMAPLLLIVVSVAGLVFGDEAVRGELFAQLQDLMGEDAAKAIQGLLASVSNPTHGVVGTIVGIGVLVVGATTVFGELQNALDRIWRAPAREKGGLWGVLRARLLSIGMILALAFLLMVSLVIDAVISALGKWWGSFFGGWQVLAQGVNIVVGFGLTTAIFAIIYKLMPRVKVEWRDVWVGALVTALLFTIGKFLIGLYIGKSGVASGFGAAGSLVVVFVWVYYSAQIFLVGAEFTWVYARTLGSMRGVAEAQKPDTASAAATGEVPTRSGSATPDGPAGAPVPAGQGDPVAPPQTAAAPTPARTATAGAIGRQRPATIRDVGTGVALVVAVRFVIPRLLRRLRRSPPGTSTASTAL